MIIACKIVFLDIDGVLNSNEHFMLFWAQHGRASRIVPGHQPVFVVD